MIDYEKLNKEHAQKTKKYKKYTLSKRALINKKNRMKTAARQTEMIANLRRNLLSTIETARRGIELRDEEISRLEKINEELLREKGSN